MLKQAYEYFFYSPYFRSARGIPIDQSLKKENAAQARSDALLSVICLIAGFIFGGVEGLLYGFLAAVVAIVLNTLRYM